MNIRKKPTIALDADGVLLDYNLAYAGAWQKAFGVYPRERDLHAYWAIDRWDVQKFSGQALEHFKRCFDTPFWENIPAMPGAVEACHTLQEAGFELVCVTALAPKFGDARRSNLRKLGFPIEQVITTGNLGHGSSPKAQALEDLQAVTFVDDHLPYMVGIRAQMHLALILRGDHGSPNAGEVGAGVSQVNSTHGNLLEFARWWIQEGEVDV